MDESAKNIIRDVKENFNTIVTFWGELTDCVQIDLEAEAGSDLLTKKLVDKCNDNYLEEKDPLWFELEQIAKLYLDRILETKGISVIPTVDKLPTVSIDLPDLPMPHDIETGFTPITPITPITPAVPAQVPPPIKVTPKAKLQPKQENKTVPVFSTSLLTPKVFKVEPKTQQKYKLLRFNDHGKTTFRKFVDKVLSSTGEAITICHIKTIADYPFTINSQLRIAGVYDRELPDKRELKALPGTELLQYLPQLNIIYSYEPLASTHMKDMCKKLEIDDKAKFHQIKYTNMTPTLNLVTDILDSRPQATKVYCMLENTTSDIPEVINQWCKKRGKVMQVDLFTVDVANSFIED